MICPVREIRNPQLFNLSGDADTVSTMANDAYSVQFQDHDADVQTINTNTTQGTTKTSASASTRVTQLEEENLKLVNDVSTLRQQLNNFMNSVQPTQQPNRESAVPGMDSQTAENP